MFPVRFFQGKWYMKAFGNQPVVSDMFLKCSCEVQSPPDVLPGESCPSLIWLTVMKIVWGPGAEGLMGTFWAFKVLTILKQRSPLQMQTLPSTSSVTAPSPSCREAKGWRSIPAPENSFFPMDWMRQAEFPRNDGIIAHTAPVFNQALHKCFFLLPAFSIGLRKAKLVF